jgi:peptide chain release factor 2
MLQAKLYTKKIQQKSKERKEMHSLLSENAWGSQIRSYVLHPYRLIKDSRTGYQTADVDGVLDGNIHGFMQSSLLHYKCKS